MTQEWPSYPVPQPPPSHLSADPARAPHLRASNADREKAVAILDAAYAEGRLTHVEHTMRRVEAESALTLGDLGPLIADVQIPTVADPTSADLPVPHRGAEQRLAAYSAAEERVPTKKPKHLVLGMPLWWFIMSAVLIFVWGVAGARGTGSFWILFPLIGSSLMLMNRRRD